MFVKLTCTLCLSIALLPLTCISARICKWRWSCLIVWCFWSCYFLYHTIFQLLGLHSRPFFKFTITWKLGTSLPSSPSRCKKIYISGSLYMYLCVSKFVYAYEMLNVVKMVILLRKIEPRWKYDRLYSSLLPTSFWSSAIPKSQSSGSFLAITKICLLHAHHGLSDINKQQLCK